MREAAPIDAGYIVPVHDARHFAGLFGLYSAERTIADEIKPLLTMIALYATERAKALKNRARKQADLAALVQSPQILKAMWRPQSSDRHQPGPALLKRSHKRVAFPIWGRRRVSAYLCTGDTRLKLSATPAPMQQTLDSKPSPALRVRSA